MLHLSRVLGPSLGTASGAPGNGASFRTAQKVVLACLNPVAVAKRHLLDTNKTGAMPKVNRRVLETKWNEGKIAAYLSEELRRELDPSPNFSLEPEVTINSRPMMFPHMTGDPATDRALLDEFYEEETPELGGEGQGRGFNENSYISITPEPRKAVTFEYKGITHASGSGTRKTSSAGAIIRPGTGKMRVNGKNMIEYFPDLFHRAQVCEPMLLTETMRRFDVVCSTQGGGKSGQAGAIKLALARALQNWDPEWRAPLKLANCLTRDPRMVERKKFGQPKARKKFQWSKR
eukprot:TRINITY_DN22352_c0_g1_i1.p1 TRINITY_DN22352_c0_g1~~TRINITY_DN22352_c0_g1_i1.p1  ORF type:complete len:303 (-),score=9.98 TRINITY_DN22352_c0_g1_i1:138-1007(-)